MIFRYLLLLFLMGFLAVTTGCATINQPSESPIKDGAQTEQEQPPREITYDQWTLGDLMIAEVATQRGELEIALDIYADMATRTNSIAVRRRATRLAAYLRRTELTRDLSLLWLDLEPDANEPREYAALAMIQLGESQAAADMIDQLLLHDTEASLARLVKQARGLDETGNTHLLKALARLTDHYPEQAPLWYARSLHLQLEGDTAGALKATENALKRNPKHEEAQLLRARLLFEEGLADEGLDFLQRLLRKQPEHRRARILYSRLLLEERKDAEARRQLKILSRDFPDDLDVRFSLALFALEQGALKSARATFAQLLEADYRPNEVHTYAGQAAEDAGDLDAAIDHYLSVNRDEQRARSHVQAARLHYQQGQINAGNDIIQQLIEQDPDMKVTLLIANAELLSRNGQDELAYEQLSAFIEQQPDNREVLYSRALIAERMDAIEQAEKDLRRILELNPDDPDALNALGYTLTDRTDRHEEAYDYIHRALEQLPDNPAVIDSMGWVLYRLGRHEEALSYLERAWESMQDGEIAAHLVEILWVLDRRSEARNILNKALEKNPDSRHLHEIQQRFPDL